MRTNGPWAPEHELRGVYRVESFEVLSDDPDADVSVAEKTLSVVRGLGIHAEIVTAQTPIRERMEILAQSIG